MSFLRPWRWSRPCASSWPRSPDRYQPSAGERLGRGVGVLPVALEQVGSGELDLAVVGDPHPDRLRRPADAARRMVGHRGAAAGRRLGRAIALEHDHAHVLPRLLEGRRQERPGTREQPQAAAEPPVDVAEQESPRPHRQPARDPPQALEHRRPALLCDLAFDRAPEQVEQLGHQQHRRDPVVVERLEDDPRVAASHVQDVGADIERVVQRHGLLERVRQREQRHQPVLHRLDDPVERPDAGQHVVVGEHHALGVAGRARGEHELEHLVGTRARPARRPAPPSRAGTSRRAPPRGRPRSSSGTPRAPPRPGRRRRDRCPARGAPPRTPRRSAGSCPGPSGRRAGRRSGAPSSRRSRRRAKPASTATTSAGGHPAGARWRGAARPRSCSAAAARDTSSGMSNRRRVEGPVPGDRRSGQRRPRGDRPGSP